MEKYQEYLFMLTFLVAIVVYFSELCERFDAFTHRAT
jgi:hypothetical protein